MTEDYESDKAIPGSIPRSVQSEKNMTDNTVTIPEETLRTLRSFAEANLIEYGNPDVCRAIVDAGIALDIENPAPETYNPGSLPMEMDEIERYIAERSGSD